MRRALAFTLAAALVATIGCTSKSSSSSKKRAERRTLRVGVLFTTSGQGGDLAQAVLGAAAMAGDHAKRLGITLNVVQLDYAGNAARVPALIEQAKSSTDAIVVGTNDPAVTPPLRATSELPVLYPLSSDDALLAGAENAFRFGPSNEVQAKVLTEYLVTKRKYRRIALLSDDTSFGKEGRSDLNRSLEALGFPPILDLSFKPGGDIHTPVSQAGQKRADALIVWAASENEAARIVVEAHKMGLGYQIALSGNLANATFAKNATAQVTPVAFRDGLLSVGPWAGPWFRLQRIIGFYQRFREENSALAPVQAASVYDAVLALVRAARDVGTTASDLASGLESLENFTGAGVPLTFGPDKHDGMDADDIALYAYTKDQNSAGGDFAPEVDTGGGFFTILHASLNLPENLAYLAGDAPASPSSVGSPTS